MKKISEYMSDEKILYDSYHQFALTRRPKSKKVDIACDKAVVSSMVSRSSLAITQLAGIQPVVSIQKTVLNAKRMYAHYLIIRDRHPSCISASLKQNIDKMIREVCKREAEMIKDLRIQETDGGGIDIQAIFGKQKYLKQLGNQLAKNIVRSAIYSDESAEYVHDLFITNSGKRFHRLGCPFCSGRNLIPVTRDLIESRGLRPCKCLSTTNSGNDRGCITVFIDESIHPVVWDRDGKAGTAGSYSYVLCRGYLSSETHITEENVITRGVDYISENEHIDRITKAAIEKTLVLLAYDYEFVGKVKILTDNQSVVKNWKETGKNERLSKLFAGVEVRFIPRKGNKVADELCRNRMLLDIPIEVYKDIVEKYSKVNTLEERIEELEEQLAATEVYRRGRFDSYIAFIRS